AARTPAVQAGRAVQPMRGEPADPDQPPQSPEGWERWFLWVTRQAIKRITWSTTTRAAPRSSRRDFRHIKADDLELRPVYHYPEERVKAHVLIRMLACYLTWHLRRAWVPLTFTDEDPAGGDPVAPPAAPPPPRPRPPASTTKCGSRSGTAPPPRALNRDLPRHARDARPA
ncbi:MAG TPA: hypothetical protein VLW50_18025, partial [Streptosporangiaceae bacterium]|nr:hypothetical protein [Streptosporangiaceae bacterium]